MSALAAVVPSPSHALPVTVEHKNRLYSLQVQERNLRAKADDLSASCKALRTERAAMLQRRKSLETEISRQEKMLAKLERHYDLLEALACKTLGIIPSPEFLARQG